MFLVLIESLIIFVYSTKKKYMFFIITKLSATHCPHINMFMLFKLLNYSYELTVKIHKDMAFIRVFGS